tara:strand:+ start:1549 stop:1779 length:231 start_codon:yes stop_codon:yes gene_type:complete
MSLFSKEFQQDMDDFFEELDNVVTLVHEVNGEVVTESVQDVLERENMVDDEEVDVITDHLGELGQLEMEAELAMGI